MSPYARTKEAEEKPSRQDVDVTPAQDGAQSIMNRRIIRTLAVLISASLIGVDPARALSLCADRVIQNPAAFIYRHCFESEALSSRFGSVQPGGYPTPASEAIDQGRRLVDSES